MTDVAYKGGPLGGHHVRLDDDPPAQDRRHGGTYRLEGASYVWAADPARAAADGDEASAVLGAEVPATDDPPPAAAPKTRARSATK